MGSVTTGNCGLRRYLSRLTGACMAFLFSTKLATYTCHKTLHVNRGQSLTVGGTAVNQSLCGAVASDQICRRGSLDHPLFLLCCLLCSHNHLPGRCMLSQQSGEEEAELLHTNLTVCYSQDSFLYLIRTSNRGKIPTLLPSVGHESRENRKP